MSGRSLGDPEAIEVVELLSLGVESCRAADRFVSVAAQRIAGVGTATTEVRHHAARMAAMLSRAISPAGPGATR